MTFYTLVFYEYFIDHNRKLTISKHFKIALIFSIILLVTIIFLFLLLPQTLVISYLYAKLGIVAIILPIALGFPRPRIADKMTIVGIYFFFLYFLFEVVSVPFNAWIYRGTYIGTISLLGLNFPFEELFFWMLFYAPTIVAFYEEFVDDCK